MKKTMSINTNDIVVLPNGRVDVNDKELLEIIDEAFLDEVAGGIKVGGVDIICGSGTTNFYCPSA